MQYVTFEKQPNALVIRLLPGVELDGTEEFADVIEYQLTTGWEWVYPEEIGALTDAPIISDTVQRDDHTNELVNVGDVYAFMDYQVVNPVAHLRQVGALRLEKAPPTESKEN